VTDAQALGGEPPSDDRWDAKGVASAAGAHFAHDLYTSFLGPLVPAIQDKLGVSLAVASLMVPAQQVPSIAQPFIGYLADRTSRRLFVVISPTVAAISLSSLGLAPNIAVVLLMLLGSGLASAMFHAPAVSLVGEFGGRKVGRAMSIFMAGGELARTIGPLIITGAIAVFTLEGSFVVAAFGITASIILFFTLDTTEADIRSHNEASVDIRPLLRARKRPIFAVLAIAILSGIVTTPFSFFLVELLVEKGHGEWYGSFALSTVFAAGIVGALVAGTLSDQFGRRNVIGLLFLLAAPLSYLYLWAENGSWAVLLLLATAGAVMMAPRTIILAAAAEVLPEARGPMAGMLLALGFVSTSIAAVAFGAFADRVGIENAYWIVPAIWVLGLPAVALLPKVNQVPQA
jgi:FSR family fosmidomycin resistance protein-like MFS transporter